MKAKSNSTTKKRVEPPKVNPPNPPAAPPRESPADDPLYGLELMQEIALFLSSSPGPSAMDCEDIAQRVYKRVDGLLEVLAVGDAKLDEDNCGYADPPMLHALDGARFQVQFLRLIGRRLFDLYRKTGLNPFDHPAAL